jgi:hypothetical protein
MPQSEFVTLSGYQVRTSHTDALVGGRLELGFENLRETVARQIVTHYQAQQSTFDVFTLSAKVWAGMGSDYVTPAGQKWRYAGPPGVSWSSPDVMTVNVSLVAVRD